MEITRGYVRLFRQIDEWEWYDNPYVKAVFIHCLIKANEKNKTWKGLNLKRGQFITSYEKIAAANGLTIQQTRTALKQLQLTHEIDYQTTNQYTVISIKNFNLYQATNTQKVKADSRATNKQNGGQLTTTNNIEDYSNTSYIISSSSSIEKNLKISEEEEEILKKYSKEKNKVKFFRPWLRKLINNGDLIEVLEKAKKWIKKQEEKISLKNIQSETAESEEEKLEAMKKAREIVDKVRRKK